MGKRGTLSKKPKKMSASEGWGNSVPEEKEFERNE
jgi:hypothetical protein